jgi:hypothetical protein
LILVIVLAGCGSAETKDAAEKPHAVAEPAQDSPPPAWATAEAPEFADPKPPIPVTAKLSKEVESTRDRLLREDDGR